MEIRFKQRKVCRLLLVFNAVCIGQFSKNGGEWKLDNKMSEIREWCLYREKLCVTTRPHLCGFVYNAIEMINIVWCSNFTYTNMYSVHAYIWCMDECQSAPIWLLAWNWCDVKIYSTKMPIIDSISIENRTKH